MIIILEYFKTKYIFVFIAVLLEKTQMFNSAKYVCGFTRTVVMDKC